MMLTSNLSFAQWSSAFADNQTLTAAVSLGCFITPISCRSPARALKGKRKACQVRARTTSR
jgi:hypothetical protein